MSLPTLPTAETSLEVINQDLEIKPFTFGGRTITVGKQMGPLKEIIYGDNGVGKTTLAASGKKPIISDMEGNCNHIDAPKIRIYSIEEHKEFLRELLSQQHDYKTLVVDSLDSIESMISEKLNKTYSSNELSYGKDKAKWVSEINELIDLYEKLSTRKGMNIIFTAHWKVKAANNPMVEQYDRYDLRINEHMRTGFCNWVQCILLAMKEVQLEESKSSGFGKKRAKNIERRVLYTRGSPTYYGKNVFNLPEKMPMDWGELTSNIMKFYNK